MFVGDLNSLTRILIMGALSFVLVVIILRVAGKRTLSKMNSFDFIVTVALGSVLATIVTSQDLALLDGIAAFAILIFMQFITSWLSVRSDWFDNLVKASPKLLLYQGKFIDESMKKERISKTRSFKPSAHKDMNQSAIFQLLF